ncbi:MAG TPA: hypothetical protein VF736_15805 [Pyrinomonadaceae bacterium]|jgi:hypothetical protein
MDLRKRLLGIAWASFGASLLLPAIKTSGDFFGFLPLGGWGFFCLAGSLFALAETLARLLLKGAVREVYPALLGVCNLLMLASPVIIFSIRRGVLVRRAVFVAAALLVCLAGIRPSLLGEGLTVGYYVWCLSFILLAVAVNVRAVREP